MRRAGAAPGRAKPEAGSGPLCAKLARIGIRRDFDFVLHLPLRYEDETRIVSIAQASSDAPVQIEATVLDSRIVFRPRRQLAVRVGDDSGEVALRFFNFYPSQHKALAPGVKLRAFGEIRGGMLGGEMIHPRFHILHGEEPLPMALTPVYPTTAGLAQTVLRRMIADALGRADLAETLPEAVRAPLGLNDFAASVIALHRPAPGADESALASALLLIAEQFRAATPA